MYSSTSNSAPEALPWGSFAVVSYLPEALATFLAELRLLLPGPLHPEAHITFLPPRALAVPLEMASRQIEQILGHFKPFELELGFVRYFRETNVPYLSVEDEQQQLLRMHACLNRGDLYAAEQFEYIPHVTLGGALPLSGLACCLQKVERAWQKFPLSRRFLVTEATLLWQEPGCLSGEWSRVGAYPLRCWPVSAIQT